MAEFLINNIEDETICFVNREYEYKWNCMRMQALLLNEPMVIISTDDYLNHIEKESYIISYSNTKICEELSEHYALVLENEAYCIYANK